MGLPKIKVSVEKYLARRSRQAIRNRNFTLALALALASNGEAAAVVARLLRSLRLDAVVEPTRLFDNNNNNNNNPGGVGSQRRPDVFIIIRSPRCSGKQAFYYLLTSRRRA